ncbi:MAG: hypothetical protein LUQ26_10450 [Methylococcaceae bacterium]|nr:hypothetical protein [Methylococcaceae bacterium]
MRFLMVHNGKTSYRIFVNNAGKRESETFSTSRLAIDWAEKRQREIERSEVYGEKTSLLISQVITDYQSRFSAGMKKVAGSGLLCVL